MTSSLGSSSILPSLVQNSVAWKQISIRPQQILMTDSYARRLRILRRLTSLDAVRKTMPGRYVYFAGPRGDVAVIPSVPPARGSSFFFHPGLPHPFDKLGLPAAGVGA